ncbi:MULTISPECIES: 50S ribosomal protein L6 [unclassified Saccharicrinis]|uniref:50S ribosomal protein L6 n=1 Tax=unclassified Saccharicrinis TaxID=2646859 RepID=UPI003D3320CE
MSRIGKQPISIPAGVTVTVKENLVTVKGPKGELSQEINPEMTVEVNDGQVEVKRPSESKNHRSQHGLCRSLINNMVEGVSNGFVKKMELVGVGYRATNQGQILELSLGFSHPIHIQLPAEIKVEAVTDRKSNPIITLESADKQLLGQICAKIRSLRKPEPYKGKGVKFVGEQIRRKAGKSAKV